jgi:predicted nucleic acid-binding protein
MNAFFDTNILVYAQQEEAHSPLARKLIEAGGLISVQVLNEFTNVLRRKLKREWTDIEAAIADVLIIFGPARPLTADTHASALVLARDHGFSFYDALIIAAASEARCGTLFSEDMQHGRTIGGLTIINPFR